jgi:hypothetical protein
MCPPPYISSSGILVRDGRARCELSRPRLALAAVLVAALVATNPANQLQDWRLPPRSSEETPRSSSTSSWLDGVLSSLQSAMDGPRRRTNYGLFSLRSGAADGRIHLQALTLDVPICQKPEGGDDLRQYPKYSIGGGGGSGRGLLDPACGWIEDTFCHGLVWDVRANRPFAAHRVLEGLLLAWALMAWCLQPGWWPAEPGWRRPLATLGSVLCFPSIVEDLISCNLLVYPALESMDRLLTASASGNRNLATQRFYGSALLLIGGIGGMSNLLSTTLSKRGTFGLHGSIAASLGYLLATKPSQLLVRYWGLFHMTASDILLAVTAIGLVDALRSPSCDGSNREAQRPAVDGRGRPWQPDGAVSGRELHAVVAPNPLLLD